ncbi:MAG TPA: phosphoglycerate kinase [Thermomicrobiales bacterium]|nr:phosphoglycerate kinase [Thermomicrobiales bacterium]
MTLRTLDGVNVFGKRAIVRVDFNVPVENGEIQDDTRIQAALPTLKRLLDGGASLILISHLGRPKGNVNPDLSLRPVARRLSELLGRPVTLADDVIGDDAHAKAANLRPGDVLLLENVRFEPGEEKNDDVLARELAGLGDLYVNDAFGTAHRAHASTVGIAAHLPSYAGDLMVAEVNALGSLTNDPARPFVAILGGAKVSDKIGVIENLLSLVDAVLLGGGMANTFLLAEGKAVGDSLVESDFVDTANDVLSKASDKGVDVLLPVDVVAAQGLDGEAAIVDADSIPDGWAAFDIGPRTVQDYGKVIANAKTIFWNGPMGVFERPAFASGTLGVARAVAESDAFTVVGGGDSVSAIEQSGLADRISHISTGGGASLEFIEGRTLPGIAALEDKGAIS